MGIEQKKPLAETLAGGFWLRPQIRLGVQFMTIAPVLPHQSACFPVPGKFPGLTAPPHAASNY
jgi:hypothetical protein